MSMGKRIEAVRKRAKLSQDAFAAHLDVSRRTLHSWERDQSAVPALALAKLREEFDVDPEWVILGTGLEPQRHFHSINWDLYDDMIREIGKLAQEVRLVLSDDQIERLARIEFSNGTRLTGPERSRLKEFLRALALER